jgi:hypothetical protein
MINMVEVVLIVDQLSQAIREAAGFNRHDTSAPKVILWPDGERLWEKALTHVADHLPELLILDPVNLGPNRGPSTWLRYQLTSRTWDRTPIVYLSGISRAAFRQAQTFPEPHRHLYALQFEGQFWTQANGKDWTPLAFLQSENGGLGLRVAQDAATLRALSEQLELLLQTPVARLTGRQIDAAFINQLATGDSIGHILKWLANPAPVRQAMAGEQWRAFCEVCKADLGLDPEKDGERVAAERLLAAEGLWQAVWTRFQESPATYPGVRQALAGFHPQDLFDTRSERMPDHNRAQEAELRASLVALGDMPTSLARSRLKDLAIQHAPRAQWVWAALGDAPLALTMVHLRAMLDGMALGLPGDSWDAWAEHYLAHGWRVDAAAWQSLACVSEPTDQAAVGVALRAVYLPWLQDQAERIQQQADSYPHRSPASAPVLPIEAGTLLLFVDGLRMDLALLLKKDLETAGYDVAAHMAWAALPTVTATAKSAWLPLAASYRGDQPNPGFEPNNTSSGKPQRSDEMHKQIQALGCVTVPGDHTGDPVLPGWMELGAFDHYGHQFGDRFAAMVGPELDTLRRRIHTLFGAGWRTIHVITDHGWLWMPGGLPKVDLPKHLTSNRWSRCAMPEPGAVHDFPVAPWYWGNEHPVVLAPGAACFTSGNEYAHGGLSLQEALTVHLVIRSSGGLAAHNPVLEELRWTGLRLHVRVRDVQAEVRFDLRRHAGDATSSLLPDQASRVVDSDGQLSVLLGSDDHLGLPAVGVLLMGDRVVCQVDTIVGEN